MSEAIKLIVDGYLSLQDRSALEELRAHRQRLRKRIQDQPNAGGLGVVSQATRLFDDELRVIEAALASF